MSRRNKLHQIAVKLSIKRLNLLLVVVILSVHTALVVVILSVHILHIYRGNVSDLQFHCKRYITVALEEYLAICFSQS